MGKLRTIAAWLGVSTVGLVSGLPHVTLADDAGPGREVRAIRHDLPVVLQAQLQRPYSSDKSALIDSVAVDGSAAVVQWHASSEYRIGYATRRFGLWWLDKEIYIADGAAIGSSAKSEYGPTDWYLANVFGASDTLVDLAARTLSEVQSANARFAKCPAAGTPHLRTYIEPCSVNTGIFPIVDVLAFSSQPQYPTTLGGYQMKVVLATNDAPLAATIEGIKGRAPTEAESWVTFGGNSYFFFSGTVASSAPVHVQAGTTIDVWFPFVLDSSLFYGLTIAHADKPIGPIDGTLKDNVVHFVLPEFTLPPAATLMGEIEGDSFRHE